MKAKNKRQIAKISILIISIIVILTGITYAFFQQVLTGEKHVVISAGTLDLVLEEENEITINDALPMYDQVGMIQEKSFNFSLVNKISTDVNYILKLQEIETGTLDKSIVKYGLIKNNEKKIDFLSNIVDGVIDKGTIVGSDTINYELRLWIDSEVTNLTQIQSKFLSFKLSVEVEQTDSLVNEKVISVNWKEGDDYLETINISEDFLMVKISDKIITTENILGLNLKLEANKDLISCGENCSFDEVLTEEKINEFCLIDQTTGNITCSEILLFSSSSNTVQGVTISPGIWTIAIILSDGKFSPLITKLTINEENPTQKTVTFAGITKNVNETKSNMFNYTSIGCTASDDFSNGVTSTCLEGYEATNGIYMMEDDDGPSYFYRDNANNLVKFGEYTKDYYVYRTTITSGANAPTYDFITLEECIGANYRCSEENKVLKHGKGTPMYWRIVRINGDNSIRMIYAGTSPDSTGDDTGIGVSSYSSQNTDIKYTGYSYDRITTEVDSNIKKSIDAWYKQTFEETKYDDIITEGKFCNDTSNLSDLEIRMFNTIYPGTHPVFNVTSRNMPKWFVFNKIVNSTPTFKCAPTTETYGGNYTLKVGLVTTDEAIAAGGQLVGSNSYYLSDNSWFWTMSPGAHINNMASACNIQEDGSINFGSHVGNSGLLRPVINLSPNVLFKSGTDGSVLSPYELVE